MREFNAGYDWFAGMTPEEIRATRDRHRSPLLLRCLEDYLAGQRFSLNLVHTDDSVLQPNG